MAQQCSVVQVEGIDLSLSGRKAYATYNVRYHRGVDTSPKAWEGGSRCENAAEVLTTWVVNRKRYTEYFCGGHLPNPKYLYSAKMHAIA